MSEDKNDPIEKMPHLTTVRQQWELRQKAAKTKFRIVDGKVEAYEAAPAADLATVEQQARHGLYLQMMDNLVAGQEVDGKGVYFGTWQLMDKEGNALSPVFNLFAAPTDLRDEAGLAAVHDYGDAQARIAVLENWYGHDGTNYANEKEFFQAVTDDSYAGGWVMPPLRLLVGVNEFNEFVQPDNLFSHINEGAFQGSYAKAPEKAKNGDTPHWYWSSTEPSGEASFAMPVDLAKGGGTPIKKSQQLKRNNHHFSCRPIRLEPKP